MSQFSKAGFFKGTTAQQDTRFSDKRKKLLKTMKFGEGLERKVDMTKVNIDILRPWITQRITELLGMEDDVVAEFVYNQLEEKQFPDAREMQINLTGLLSGKNARIFLRELWDHLCSAQDNITGIPNQILEQIKNEIKQRQTLEEQKEKAMKEQATRLGVEVEKSEQRNISPEKSFQFGMGLCRYSPAVVPQRSRSPHGFRSSRRQSPSPRKRSPSPRHRLPPPKPR